MLPITFQTFYANKNVDASMSGQTLAEPFQLLSDYSVYSQAEGLTGQSVIIVNDADNYDDLIFEDVNNQSTTENEIMYVYAPFAAFEDVRFNRTSLPADLFLERYTLVCNHVVGDVVLSRCSNLKVTGETGISTSARPNDEEPFGTNITFDNRGDLGRIHLSLERFDGSIDFSGLGTNRTAELVVNIADWGTDNTKLIEALKTLPASGNLGKCDIVGQINGVNFPLKEPVLHATTHISFGRLNGFNIEISVSIASTDLFNIDRENLSGFIRTADSNGILKIFSIPIFFISSTDTILTTTWDLTSIADRLSPLESSYFIVVEFLLSGRYRYLNGQKDVVFTKKSLNLKEILFGELSPPMAKETGTYYINPTSTKNGNGETIATSFSSIANYIAAVTAATVNTPRILNIIGRNTIADITDINNGLGELTIIEAPTTIFNLVRFFRSITFRARQINNPIVFNSTTAKTITLDIDVMSQANINGSLETLSAPASTTHAQYPAPTPASGGAVVTLNGRIGNFIFPSKYPSVLEFRLNGWGSTTVFTATANLSTGTKTLSLTMPNILNIKTFDNIVFRRLANNGSGNGFSGRTIAIPLSLSSIRGNDVAVTTFNFTSTTRNSLITTGSGIPMYIYLQVTMREYQGLKDVPVELFLDRYEIQTR